MKKIYTSLQYKKHSASRSRSTLRIRQKKNKQSPKVHQRNKLGQFQSAIRPQRTKSHYSYSQRNRQNAFKPLHAPSDFRLLDNTQECLRFFSKLRDVKKIVLYGGQKRKFVTLKYVEHIDYAAISVFKSIIEDLNNSHIIVRGDFPQDSDCRRDIVNSGFLEHLVDDRNRPFNVDTKSNIHMFKKGTGKMTEKDSRVLSDTIKEISAELTGRSLKCSMLKSLLLEICGNSIEWSRSKDSDNARWQLGVIYEGDHVIITVADVGAGILGTLFTKFNKLLKSLNKSDKDILYGAFLQKYGSNTKEINRNQGLRLVKRFHDDKCLIGLKVLTNNVLLDFDSPGQSVELSSAGITFSGTYYQWILDAQCINKINNNIWN